MKNSLGFENVFKLKTLLVGVMLLSRNPLPRSLSKFSVSPFVLILLRRSLYLDISWLM
jgi:hypothetical protein